MSVSGSVVRRLGAVVLAATTIGSLAQQASAAPAPVPASAPCIAAARATHRAPDTRAVTAAD
ncbi:MAG: hypothetical protein ABI873_08370, partial [Marmoricola sp.]